MLQNSVLVFSLALCVGYVRGFLQLAPSSSFIRNKNCMITLYQLKEGSAQRIEEISNEYSRCQMLDEDEDTSPEMKADLQEKIKAYETILNCVEALKTIDTDLELFADHLRGDDDKLKSTALVFYEEFSVCKVQIEGQLNKILWTDI
jgi:hypothetical protein